MISNEYPSLNCQCYHGLGTIAQDKGLYQLSLQFYFKSLQNVSNQSRFHLLNNIGLIYDYLEQYDKALKYYFQSLSLIISDQDKSMSFNNIGITFAKIKQYDQAIQYLQNSLQLRKIVYPDNDIQIGISYSNIAITYLSIQQFNKAFEYFHFALKYFQFDQPNLYKAIIYQNIANAFQQTNHFKKAFQFYQDSLEIFKQLKPIDHPNIIFIQQQIQLVKKSK
jgi:tetratricopeptide (TPR) repeat protein